MVNTFPSHDPGTLDASSTNTLAKEIARVERYMIAQHVKWRRSQEKGKGVDQTALGFDLVEEEQFIEDALNDIESLKDTDPDKYDAVVEAARRYRAYAKETMRYRMESGLITEEDFNERTKDQDNYVALRRSMEEFGGKDLAKIKGKSFKSLSDPKARGRGSDKKIENPYSNLIAVTMDSYYDRDWET